MTSYQRLKLKNKELYEEINKILTDKDYYFECSIRYGIKNDIERAWWFGNSTKIGKISGLNTFLLKKKNK